MATLKTGRPNGRPSLYSTELAEDICKQVSVGRSIKTISQQEGMPSDVTIYRWAAENPEFQSLYARAREHYVIVLGEEIVSISDDETKDSIEVTDAKGNTYVQANHAAVQRARLKVDTRKWLMSKLLPKQYGERAEEKKSEDILTTAQKIRQAVVDMEATVPADGSKS